MVLATGRIVRNLVGQLKPVTTPVWSSAGTEPLRSLSPWDVVYLAGRQLPGVCRVSGKGVAHEIDIKKSPGKDGATFTDLGRTVSRFTITMVLSCQLDWDNFEGVIPALQPLNKTGKLQALAVQSPQLNVLGIRSAYVEEVGIPTPGRERGTMEVQLQCLEYRQVTDAVGSGTPKKDIKLWDNKGNGYPKPVAPMVASLPSKTDTQP